MKFSLGSKEINSYLILAQLVFQFINNYTEMSAEMDPKVKKKLDDANELKDVFSKKEKPMDYTLKQIIFNEGLSRPRKQCIINLWKKAITKVMDQTSRKDFEMTFIQVKLKGASLTMTDNIAKKEQPLLILSISDIDVKMDSISFNNANPAKTERLF